MTRFIFLLLIIFLSFFPLSFSFAACTTDFDNNIQKIVDEGRVTYQLVGMQLSILCKDEIVPHDFYSGTTMLDNNLPVNENTLFQAGSITKSFTAALILKLETDGVLSINDEIGTWLPQIPDTWKKITIKQLLNHTSGLSDYVNTTSLQIYMSDVKKQWQQNELLQFIINEPLLFPIGEGYFYSNTNYLLAGMIADTALISQGKSYANEVNIRFFKPLNLVNTYYLPYMYNENIFNRMAHGYYPLHFPKVTDVTSYNMSFTNTAGANVSTAHDISLWLQNLMHGGVLSSVQFTEMQSMVDMQSGLSTLHNGYGLGIYQQDFQNEMTWMHRGITMGYHNGMYYFPCRDMVIAYTGTPSFSQRVPEDSEEIIKKIILYVQQIDPKKECFISEGTNPLISSKLGNHIY